MQINISVCLIKQVFYVSRIGLLYRNYDRFLNQSDCVLVYTTGTASGSEINSIFK